MELFLPSLLVLFLSALLVFLVIPRFSPFIIFMLCSVFLVIASYTHFKIYANEYRNLMFFDVSSYGSIILIIIITVGILFATSNLLKGVQFKMPRIVLSDSKQISNVKDFTNIPLTKIRELEEQV